MDPAQPRLAPSTRRHRCLHSCIIACAGLTSACTASDAATTSVEFFETDGHSFSWADRRTIRSIAIATVDEVRPLLPGLPRAVVIRVQSADPDEVIDVTGENGTTAQPDTVMWSVDTNRTGGATAVAEAELRPCLFHELHHLVRGRVFQRNSILELAITEGLAIAFERDYSNAASPWGWYPPDAALWVDELRRLPSTAERSPWVGRHPDGRRWIALKAGTYLADRAIRASGKSPATLVTTTPAEILALAESGRDR
jgi:hypothetical protein